MSAGSFGLAADRFILINVGSESKRTCTLPVRVDILERQRLNGHDQMNADV